ncbi:methylated-DNA--protein-cysteine methyltransferase [Pelobates fuscus]|uniref:methylated-DNA--protein-cysteine methyltransferase n=1 Tax=Pelobates fuscus TaxID=191477 RepID=UPI002FE4F2E5
MALKNGICKMEKFIIECPLGKVVVNGCEKGIHEIQLQSDAEISEQVTTVSYKVCETPPEKTQPMKECENWLRTYFCEPWLIEDVPIPAFHHPVFETDSFTKTVLVTLLEKVKVGETVSYKELAELAGNKKAARAVGMALSHNPIPVIIPCHRVICSNGDIGNYSSGNANKLKALLLGFEMVMKQMKNAAFHADHL